VLFTLPYPHEKQRSTREKFGSLCRNPLVVLMTRRLASAHARLSTVLMVAWMTLIAQKR
jgi:hypothetical protein